MIKKIVILLVLILSGCIGGAIEKQLTEDYWLIALDTKDDASLMVKVDGFMVNVVSPMILSYMVNENFIVVRQREYARAAKDILGGYYIVPLKKTVSENITKNVVGPFTLDRTKKELKKTWVLRKNRVNRIVND